MIVPPPAPSYTLAPDLAGLTGRISGVVVTAAVTTDTHLVIELMTPAGTLLVLERNPPG